MICFSVVGVERMGVLDVNCAIATWETRKWRSVPRSKQLMTRGPRVLCEHLPRFNRWKNRRGSKKSRLGESSHMEMEVES